MSRLNDKLKQDKITCTNGQPPSKLRSAVAHIVEKVVPSRCDLHKRSRETLPSGEPSVPNEDENAKYKKNLFLH